MFYFYPPWKQKTAGFLMFLGGIEVEHWLNMGEANNKDTIARIVAYFVSSML